MRITVLVRTLTCGDASLTFDGTQSVVLGRGASCDVRLPDASVSHRHASLRVQGQDFVLFDEGSYNGTFVGGARIAPRTSRIVRSGDRVRLGRMWIELRLDQSAVTRDVGAATRDVALALVSEALAAAGSDLTVALRVVEGRDQGLRLPLTEEGRIYTLGRGAECDLPLADADASREHAHVVRRGAVVTLRDLGAKNGTRLGDVPLAAGDDVVWRPALMLRVGRTVVALEEPIGDALARIESAADRPMTELEAALPPPTPLAPLPPEGQPASAAPLAAIETPVVGRTRRKRSGWSAADHLVVAAALCVLAMSIAGLFWLLRG